MGGWFSFFGSQPLHINENNISKLKSIRNNRIPRKLRSYTRKKGLKRGHLSHYNHVTLAKDYDPNNDPAYENLPRRNIEDTEDEKKIKNTFNFFQNPSKRGSIRNKVSSFVRSMTRKQKSHSQPLIINEKNINKPKPYTVSRYLPMLNVKQYYPKNRKQNKDTLNDIDSNNESNSESLEKEKIKNTFNFFKNSTKHISIHNKLSSLARSIMTRKQPKH